MAAPSITNTFVSNTVATAAAMNANFTDIISGLSSGSTWDVVTSSLTSTDLSLSNIPEFLKDLDLESNDGSSGSFISQVDSASGAFIGGVLLPNGKVFCVPYNYSGTDYVFNPSTGEFETQTDSAPGGGAFRGGVLMPNGKIFCFFNSYAGKDYVFNPGITTKSAEPWCYHSMFNKF